MQLKINFSMKGHQQDYVIVAFGLILLFIVLTISYLSFSAAKPPPTEETTISELTPKPTVLYRKNVQYDMNAQAKLMDKLTNQQPLSDNDKFAKAKILSLLPPEKTSGVVYQTDTITIDYTKSVDLFAVEIFTAYIKGAKAEANVWFRTHGMSQKGLCNLPVIFFLNTKVAENLKYTNIQFSPIAPSC